MREIIMVKKIVLTAGHASNAPGACANGVREEVLAAQFRNALAPKLSALGYEVITDGEGDVNQSLNDAIGLIKKHKPDLALEIHFNAGVPSATGVEILANATAKDKAMAHALAEATASVTGDKVRGDKGWKDQSSGQHSRLGYVVAGGMVYEGMFITNKQAVEVWQEKYYLVASALADAIHKQLGG